MKYLNLFFHIYQPPVQDNTIIQKIVRESYEPLTRMFLNFSDLKFTLNINFSLTDKLGQTAPQIIGNINRAYTQGNLELTESGAYHPIFPLIPFDEIRRQITINNEGNRRLISNEYNPRGIFSPGMAFEARLAPLFKSVGYDWTIADDGNLDYYGIDVPNDKIYCCEGLGVLLRSNLWSNKFADYKGQWKSGNDFVTELLSGLSSWIDNNDNNEERERDGYMIIGLDGETFGHHCKDLGEKFLHEMCEAFRENRDKLQLVHLSNIFEHFPHISQFIPPGSWSTDRVNIAQRDYFSWWKSPQNKIHTLQWEFTYFVLDVVRRIYDAGINNEMDKALYSCQYWWASCWKFDPGQIYKGVFNMMRILQHAAELLGNNYERIKEGEEIFRDLILEIKREEYNRRNQNA